MNILYTALKHVIWRFGICNYFCEISKFRCFIKTLRNFAKSAFAQNLNISRNNLYYPNHVLFKMICSSLKSLKFFLEPLRSISRELIIKSRNQDILSISKVNRTLR